MRNINDIETIRKAFLDQSYVVDHELATIVFLMYKLQRPLLIEGPAGVGKTELAQTLSAALDCKFIRLQCYEGLDVNSAVYEWNYQKQLLAIKIQEQSDKSEAEKEGHIFSKEFLLERPLLQAISQKDAPVLLIDEIDRSDEEFEAFLLELLSVYQISIPELGTIKADHAPMVILTSNRTRELSDALKRRCLSYWLDYPTMEKEMEIVKRNLPGVDIELQKQVVQFVQSLREMSLEKTPGVAETLDWTMSLFTLGKSHLDQQSIRSTLGCLLKSTDDIDKVVHSDIFMEQISS
jgi:MoxR-like ATPase